MNNYCEDCGSYELSCRHGSGDSWPRPIPVTERPPEVEYPDRARIQMYDQRFERWEYGEIYRLTGDGPLWWHPDSTEDGEPLSRLHEYNHWLPMPPKPE